MTLSYWNAKSQANKTSRDIKKYSSPASLAFINRLQYKQTQVKLQQKTQPQSLKSIVFIDNFIAKFDRLDLETEN